MEAETSPTAIAKRLEALSKWHEEYRILLNTKHEQQRAILEKREISPIVNSNTMQTIEILFPDEKNNSLQKDISGILLFDETPLKSPSGHLSKPTSGYATSESKLEDTDSAQSITKPTKYEAKNNENKSLAPKKFLRKGEGIKQRFKIEADAFNLSKLPPYKYAKSHPKLMKHKPRKQIKEVIKELVPKDFESSQDPPKLAPIQLDTHEIRFQRLLFASKTVCNSTPDSKFSSVTSVEEEIKDDSSHKSLQVLQQLSSNSQNSQILDSSSLGIAWAKVLDPSNIKPISVTKLRDQNDTGQNTLNDTDDDNLNLFELLEEKAKEGSFNLNCSLIKQILAKNFATQASNAPKDQDSDIVPISAELRKAHIEPKVDKNEISSSTESDDETEESEGDDEGSESDSDESVADIDEVEENEQDEETMMADSNTNDPTQKASACLRVHFMDEESSTMQLDDQNSKNFEESTSNVDSSALFEQMKSLVLAALAKNENQSDTTLMSSPPLNAVEIKQLAEQGRQRVAELEKEIALFKETNLQLMKAKQEHEMEKVYFMQQHEEALEQINDEKIKVEIQLHDERMKLEQERRKSEEKSRMQKASIACSERKEITKLKEEIVLLQNKLRDKEQNHTAAQARLRSQLRVVEKEQKSLYEEIERLNKENRKLEKQIAQQARERNTTMLSEINRNIVKLAGSSKSNSGTSINSNGKSSVMASKTEEKQIAPKRTSLKKTIQSNEPLKTLKITANSFTNLLPPKLTEKTNNEVHEDEETDDEPVPEPFSRHAQLEEALSFSPTAEKENSVEKTTSSFKVLTREITSADGGKEIIYPNGTIRKESGDSLTVRMMYFNGDVKETNVKEGTIKYYYSKTNTWHTTYLDGLEIIEFPNGQIEHRLPGGVIEVHYPHKNCVKIMDPKDPEKEAEYVYDDGTKVCEMRNGNKLLTLPNGQKELTTKEFKRREYPDGTIKTVYPDGSHETRYSNGRIRLKDKDGNLIIDSEMQAPNVQKQQSVAGFH